MNKKVLFIPFANFLKNQKKINILDGVIYCGGTNNSNNLYSNEFGCTDDYLGEYIHADINCKGELVIKTDFCGFYKVFWMEFKYKERDGILLSNCLHSISNYSVNYKLDIRPFIGSLFSKNQIFIQSYSNNTSLSNIKKLGWNESITISNAGFSINKDIKIIGDNYQNLINKGINQAKIALSELNSKSELNLYLSGGKDSRAILALLISMNIFPRCSTHNPEKFKGNSKLIVDKDFSIATSLVEMYNLEWFEVGKKSAVSMTFQESLEHHSFYRNGYYRYTPSQYLVYSHEWGKETQLRGGGGGLYKSTWGEYIKSSYINKNITGGFEYLEKDARTVFSSLILKDAMTSNFYEECEILFLESLQEDPKSGELDIYKALDNHYISHRNRYHFGHHRASNVEGKNIFCPLINEFFYAAATMLTKDEQDNGKLIFDIIDYCSPILNEYPYDDGYHMLLESNRTKREFIKSNESIKKHMAVTDLNKTKTQGIFSGKPYDTESESNKFITSSISELLDAEGSNINYKKMKKYIDNTKENKMHRNKLCALFSSISLNTVSSFSQGHIFSTFNLGENNDNIS